MWLCDRFHTQFATSFAPNTVALRLKKCEGCPRERLRACRSPLRNWSNRSRTDISDTTKCPRRIQWTGATRPLVATKIQSCSSRSATPVPPCCRLKKLKRSAVAAQSLMNVWPGLSNLAKTPASGVAYPKMNVAPSSVAISALALQCVLSNFDYAKIKI